MPKNRIQFQPRQSLRDFLKRYGTGEQHPSVVSGTLATGLPLPPLRLPQALPAAACRCPTSHDSGSS